MRIIVICLAVIVTFLVFNKLSRAGTIPEIGNAAPAFALPDAGKRIHTLQDYAGKWLVLYFYPKNDTPGCTKEACAFRDDLFQIEKLNARVVGISVDDTDSHAAFARKYNLPFPLLSDTDGKVADSYGALRNLGFTKVARRYTFLIDPAGRIARVYLSVDTSRHSREIIEDLKRLNGMTVSDHHTQ
ncbi:MAG TPA: peroxiredoxin [Methylophilaceae bacterium]|jgi:peroxiredoxin Q/BCP